MNDQVVYNIPLSMVEAYRGRDIVVRSNDPAELVRRLDSCGYENVAYIQIIGVEGGIEDLLRWEAPVPVDLAVRDPEADLPHLYRYAPMISQRPVRVTVPLAAGFHKIVKLALSLNFAVKLESSQPELHLTEALLQVADLYLHQSTVSQPVEFFHSLFLAFYHGQPISLWALQEEDPSLYRYVTDSGLETISARFAESVPRFDIHSFIEAFTGELLSEQSECRDCGFFPACRGHFKWPDRGYRCDGIRQVFETLSDAAEELRRDLGASAAARGIVQS